MANMRVETSGLRPRSHKPNDNNTTTSKSKKKSSTQRENNQVQSLKLTGEKIDSSEMNKIAESFDQVLLEIDLFPEQSILKEVAQNEKEPSRDTLR